MVPSSMILSIVYGTIVYCTIVYGTIIYGTLGLEQSLVMQFQLDLSPSRVCLVGLAGIW